MNKRTLQLAVYAMLIISTSLLGVAASFALAYIASASNALAYAIVLCNGGECALEFSELASRINTSIQTIELMAYALYGFIILLSLMGAFTKVQFIRKQWATLFVVLATVLCLVAQNAQSLYVSMVL